MRYNGYVMPPVTYGKAGKFGKPEASASPAANGSKDTSKETK